MNFTKRSKCIINSKYILASIRSRILAMVLDIIIAAFLILGILLLFSAFGFDINLNIDNLFATHPEIEVDSDDLGSRMKEVLKIGIGFFPVFYFFLTTYLFNGLTPGKKIVRIRVVSLYHPRLNIWHCIERSLGYVASTLELGLGFFQILWNPNRMALHDKIAETVVIKTKSVRKLPANQNLLNYKGTKNKVN